MSLYQVNCLDIYTDPEQPALQQLIPFPEICFDSDTQKLVREAEPVEPTDLVNKAYVDAAIAAAVSQLKIIEQI